VGAWSSWFSLGGYVPEESVVTSVSQNFNHLDIFVVGFDGAIWGNWWDANANNGQWNGWYSLGGYVPQQSLVSAVSRYSGHLDLFVVGFDGAIYSNWWDASVGPWSGWFSLGGYVPERSVVAALARYRDHLDLFVVGFDGAIYSNWWDVSYGWASWFSLGGYVPEESEVTAVSQDADHLDIFVVGFDGQIYTTWWDANANAGQWNPWYSVGGYVPEESVPTSVARFAVAQPSF
jgi:hypothetical protein